MKFHKVGDVFEYEGVILEVKPASGVDDVCKHCYFKDAESCFFNRCVAVDRRDCIDVYYERRIEYEYHPIYSTFEFDGKTLAVVPSPPLDETPCDYCYFRNSECGEIKCTPFKREDKNSVVFVAYQYNVEES